MNDQLLSILLFAAGAVASALLPYVRAWLDSKEPFDWRQLVGQLVAVAITIAAQMTGIANMLARATLPEAFVLGWGISGIGRFGQKSYDLARKKLNGK